MDLATTYGRIRSQWPVLWDDLWAWRGAAAAAPAGALAAILAALVRDHMAFEDALVGYLAGGLVASGVGCLLGGLLGGLIATGRRGRHASRETGRGDLGIVLAHAAADEEAELAPVYELAAYRSLHALVLADVGEDALAV